MGAIDVAYAEWGRNLPNRPPQPKLGAEMRVEGLHHVALKVHDVARAARFYGGLLGLPELRRFEDAEGLRAIWLQLGGGTLMLERSTGRAAQEDEAADFHQDPPGWHLVALSIPAADRPAWVEHLAAHDTPVVHASDFTLYVLDPEGNRVGLSSYPEVSRS